MKGDDSLSRPMSKRPITKIRTEMDTALAAKLAAKKDALYWERLQRAAQAALAGVREAVARRRKRTRR